MNTTISISTKTRELLLDFGKKSENYDDVIRRMYNALMLQKEVETFVNENEYSSLNEAIEWTKMKIKAEK